MGWSVATDWSWAGAKRHFTDGPIEFRTYTNKTSDPVLLKSFSCRLGTGDGTFISVNDDGTSTSQAKGEGRAFRLKVTAIGSDGIESNLSHGYKHNANGSTTYFESEAEIDNPVGTLAYSATLNGSSTTCYTCQYNQCLYYEFIFDNPVYVAPSGTAVISIDPDYISNDDVGYVVITQDVRNSDHTYGDIGSATFTVTYVDGDPEQSIKQYKEPLTIQSTAAFKEGHTFTNVWNTEEDGSGTSYNNDSTYSLNEDLVLYPIYTRNTYTISYNSNGYTVSSGLPSSQTKTYGNALTLSTSIPIISDVDVTGYTVTFDANGGSCSTSSLVASRTESRTFKNWNSKADGTGTSYANGGSYTDNSSATLYLQTNNPTYTVQAITLPTATRTGYAHLGWATSSTSTSGSTGAYTPTGNLTLYAVWESQGIVYIDNGTSFEPYTIWIDNGSGWDQYVAYIDNGSSWDLCGG